MTDEERMVKEAVERANERAIQIALQRSFEEQYGPGSYQRYQEQQRLSRAMSAGDIPYNTHHPVSPVSCYLVPFKLFHVLTISSFASISLQESIVKEPLTSI